MVSLRVVGSGEEGFSFNIFMDGWMDGIGVSDLTTKTWDIKCYDSVSFNRNLRLGWLFCRIY